MISLEYFFFLVVIYFYSRKTREIRSLLSSLSPWFYMFSICLACSCHFFFSLLHSQLGLRISRNTPIQPPTFALSFLRGSWEGCV